MGMRRFADVRRQGLMISAAIVAAVGMSAVAAAPVTAPGVIEVVSSQWSLATAGKLLTAVEEAGAEGLNPRDYGVARLRQAIDGGEGAGLDAAANGAALALAHDYALGRVADREAMDWHIAGEAGAGAIAADLQAAVAAGDPDRYLQSLLPSNPRYLALRAALAGASDPAVRDMLRANMERWRWMPRDLGASYLYVNVPSYQLKVVADGLQQSSYTVVVGAKDTPTPQLMSPASSLVVNPWWNVPQSIVKSSNLRPGRAGFQFTAAKSGWQVRQPPGPRNALGKIKINLVNDQAIYLHDTPAKAGFAKAERALSHGCIRVKDIDRLASELIGDAGGDGRLDTALSGSQTATLRLSRTWKVYLVYFTADMDESGAVVSYRDPYGRDAELIARLDGRPARAIQIASR